MTVKNRFVRSATTEGLADPQGFITDKLIDFTERLARGEVGLIIMGYACVSPEGKQLPKMTGIYLDEHVAALKKLCEKIRQTETGARLVFQLMHAGGQTTTEFTGLEVIGPSAVVNPSHNAVPREMSLADIRRVIADFGRAAARAREAGFDAVQMHGAHGYLINQFLSPLVNQRTDEYGGNTENRARFAIEVYKAVRSSVGDDYPVLIKLNSEDCVEGGLSLADALSCAAELERLGVDAIEVSGGVPYAGRLGPSRMRINKPDQEAYFLENARAFREKLKLPLITVGGIRSFERAEEALTQNIADYVALSRPLVREPGLIKRWKEGDRSRAACVSCARCFKETAMSEEGLGCYEVRKAEGSA